jgi:hypothetical protein
MVSNLLADSFFIAICHLTWLSSRKYGTVWYHPTSSKLWYLTTLSFVNFQGKLTGTLWNLLVCEASLFGLLCAWRRVRILRQHMGRFSHLTNNNNAIRLNCCLRRVSRPTKTITSLLVSAHTALAILDRSSCFHTLVSSPSVRSSHPLHLSSLRRWLAKCCHHPSHSLPSLLFLVPTVRDRAPKP